MRYRLFSLLILFAWLASGCRKDVEPQPNYVWFPAEELGVNELRDQRIHADANGHIYIAQNDWSSSPPTTKYWYFDGANWSEHKFEQQAGLSTFNLIVAAEDGSVWALAYGQLYQLRDGEVVDRRLIPAIIDPPFYFIDMEIANNSIWLLHTFYGLFKYDIASEDLTHHPDSSANVSYAQMVIDSESNIWIAKDSRSHNLFRYTADQQWLLAEDPDSVLGNPDVINYTNPDYYVKFNDLEATSSGAVIASTSWSMGQIRNGVYRRHFFDMNPPYYNFRKFRTAPDNSLWHYYTYEGESLLARSTGGKIEVVGDLTNAVDVGNVSPYHLTIDKKNNVWVATNRGVIVFNRDGVNY